MDPLSTYYGPNNVGLATVLGRDKRGDYFDYALDGQARRAQANQQAAQRQQKAPKH